MPVSQIAVVLLFSLTILLSVFVLSLRQKISSALTIVWFTLCIGLIWVGLDPTILAWMSQTFHLYASSIILAFIAFAQIIFTLYLLVKTHRAEQISKNLIQHLAIHSPTIQTGK